MSATAKKRTLKVPEQCFISTFITQNTKKKTPLYKQL